MPCAPVAPVAPRAPTNVASHSVDVPVNPLSRAISKADFPLVPFVPAAPVGPAGPVAPVCPTPASIAVVNADAHSDSVPL